MRKGVELELEGGRRDKKGELHVDLRDERR